MIQSEGRLRDHFQNYSEYHRTPGNKLSHQIGIPLIAITLLGLLARIGIPGTIFDLGLALWAGSAIWYLALGFVDGKLSRPNITITAPFSLIALAFYFIGRTLPVEVCWAGFIIGWIAQGVGHYKYEKRSPAFFTNVRHLFVGPLWIYAGLLS